MRPRSAVPKRCRARGTPAPYLSTSLRSKTGMAGARGGRSPETVPIQSVSLELFIAISVACGDICPRAAGPACRRGPPSPRNTCCAAQNRVVPIARRGPGRKTRPARPPCCGWPASWSISPSRGRKNSRVTRLCARTWLEFRAAALKSPSRGRPGRQGFSADTNRRILSHVGLGQPLGTAPDHSTNAGGPGRNNGRKSSCSPAACRRMRGSVTGVSR